MEVRTARRAVSDVVSVCRSTSPTTATRWVVSLMARLPECAGSRSLRPADRIWAHSGASFRTSTGAVVSLPAAYTSGAREMYCRDVYLRSGLAMPTSGWVIDLGANSGLFSIWAALTGAQVVAVEAQQGFAEEIHTLAAYNGVDDRVHVKIAMASGVTASGATVGAVADDQIWSATSHGAPTKPADVSVPELMSEYQIDRVGLLKVDIEGGEFAVFAEDDLRWLEQVDQVALELHLNFGDAASLVERLRGHGFVVDMRDNDGNRVAVTSPRLEYAYCSRLSPLA
jgi:FkbM family methyltransferase